MSVPRFWREIPQRYNLKASKCPLCNDVRYPPREICPSCRRASVGRLQSINLVGRGMIVEWTRVHKPAPGYAMQVPYIMALIKTEEGPVVMGQIVDTATEPQVGAKVQAVFRKLASDGESGVIHYGTKWILVESGSGEGRN